MKAFLPLQEQEKFEWFYAWLGVYPKHWKVIRGKFLFMNQKEINSRYQCELVLALTLNGVMHKDDLVARSLVPADYATYQVFYPDDLVFKLIDLENYQTSRVGHVTEKGIMSPAYIRITPITEVNTRFFYYFYYSLYLQGIYNFMGMGVRASLSASDLLNIPLLVPPMSEQAKIASFLDRSLGEIGFFERAAEGSFKIMKEYRASLIYAAITGKLKL